MITRTEKYFALIRTEQYNVISHQDVNFCKTLSFVVNPVVAPTAQPTLLVFANVTATSYDVSFTASVGGANLYMAVRRTSASPTFVPVDGTTYSVGQSVGDGEVRHFGAAVSFSESGLTASTTYHYDVFAVNGGVGTYKYLTTSPLEGSQATPSSFSFLNAIHLNGANSSIVSNNSSNYGNANNTVAGWFKMDSDTTGVMLGQISNTNRGWGIGWIASGGVSNGFVRCWNGPYGGAQYGQISGVNATGWVHIGMAVNLAGATNADKMKIYLNGVLQTPSFGGTIVASGNLVTAIRYGADRFSTALFLDGWLDQWAVWSDFDVNHIIDHYNAGVGADAGATNLVIENKFNESNPSATTADTMGTTWTLTNFNFDTNDGFGTH